MRKPGFLLLFLLLCLCAAPALADTEGDFTYSVSSSEAKILSYTGSADTLIIPHTLGGYPVTAIGYCAFRNCAALTQVVICEGVSSIGSRAFKNCASLSQIMLPQPLTMLGSHAFYGCANLLEIAVPESIERLHPYAFYGCSAARLCSLESHAARVLSDYGYSFTSPDYPQLSLMAFGSALTVTDCSESAASVSFPDGVITIDGFAIFNCNSLRELTIPHGVTEIAYSAF